MAMGIILKLVLYILKHLFASSANNLKYNVHICIIYSHIHYTAVYLKVSEEIPPGTLTRPFFREAGPATAAEGRKTWREKPQPSARARA